MSIFGVIGYVRGPIKDSAEALWPVVYRVEREDAAHALGVCVRQREDFIAEISPVRDQLYEAKRDLRRNRRAKRIPRGVARERDRVLQIQVGKLVHREAEITNRFGKDMLDPMFPTGDGTNVEYKLIEFRDDPRDVDAAVLIRMRAELHGSSDEDDDDNEQSNDLDSPGWNS